MKRGQLAAFAAGAVVLVAVFLTAWPHYIELRRYLVADVVALAATVACWCLLLLRSARLSRGSLAAAATVVSLLACVLMLLFAATLARLAADPTRVFYRGAPYAAPRIVEPTASLPGESPLVFLWNIGVWQPPDCPMPLRTEIGIRVLPSKVVHYTLKGGF
jgi:hypothetical protein